MSINNINYYPRWIVDSEYSYSYDCEAYGCDSICRCSKIDHLKITKVDITGTKDLFSDNKSLKKISLLDWYCIDRLLRINKCYDVNLYEAHTVNGYYGEEIRDYDFSNKNILEKQITDLLSLNSDIDKIMFVLRNEYGYILPELELLTSANIQKVELNKITMNNGYMKKISQEYESSTIKDLPIGILFDNRLIDGYHRLCDSLNKNKKEDYFIVLK